MANYVGMTNAELLIELSALGEELIERLVNYLDVGQDSQEAADEGLLLVVKAQKAVADISYRSSILRRDKKPSLRELNDQLKELASA